LTYTINVNLNYAKVPDRCIALPPAELALRLTGHAASVRWR